jgi:predicted TIM-barrel enzyme
MAGAGVDNIIVHFGNSSGGSIGSKSVMAQDAAVQRTALVLDALAGKYSDRIITIHGGAIETPEHFTQFWKHEPRIDGYVGGSSAERFPIESSVVEVTRRFRDIRRPAGAR